MLAVQHQDCEPVSSTLSLINGNLQGIFVSLAPKLGQQRPKSASFRRFLEFQTNKEQGKSSNGTGTALKRSANHPC